MVALNPWEVHGQDWSKGERHPTTVSRCALLEAWFQPRIETHATDLVVQQVKTGHYWQAVTAAASFFVELPARVALATIPKTYAKQGDDSETVSDRAAR